MDTTGKPVEDDTCAKCGGKDPDRLQEDYLKEIKCVNCRQNHPAYARSCEAFKKEKRNTWGETQEECVFPGSKKNSRELHGRKQLLLCYTEGGYN